MNDIGLCVYVVNNYELTIEGRGRTVEDKRVTREVNIDDATRTTGRRDSDNENT